MSKPSSITDIELSQKINTQVAAIYQEALDIISYDAESAIVKFRMITELLCSLIATANKYQLVGKVLRDHISELYDAQIVSYSFKSRLDEVRSLSNSSAHSKLILDPLDKEKAGSTIKEFRQVKAAEAQELSKKVRVLTIENMQDARDVLSGSIDNTPVTQIPLGELASTIKIAQAMVSRDYRDYLEAARICEAMQTKHRMEDPFNFDHDREALYDYYVETTRTLYKTAYKLSSGIPAQKLGAVNVPVGKEKNHYIEHANAEAMFKYFLYCLYDRTVEDDGLYENIWLCKAASDKQYPEAMTFYARYLYEEGDHTGALKLHHEAIERGSYGSYAFAADVYSDENSDFYDEKKTLEYLNQGIELNDSQSNYFMGLFFYEGNLVEEDKDKAKEYLEKAIELNNVEAEDFFFKKYQIEPIQRIMKETTERIEGALSQLLKGPNYTNIGRNSPCPCNSGKKFKKCCYMRPEKAKNIAMNFFQGS